MAANPRYYLHPELDAEQVAECVSVYRSWKQAVRELHTLYSAARYWRERDLYRELCSFPALVTSEARRIANVEWAR